MNKQFEKISVDAETADSIRYIAKSLNKPISAFMKELFQHLLNTCLQFKQGCNISYANEYDYLKIEFSGASAISISHFQVPEGATDLEVDKILDERMKERIAKDLVAQAEKANNETFSDNEGLAREGI